MSIDLVSSLRAMEREEALAITEEEHLESVRVRKQHTPKHLPDGWTRDFRAEQMSEGQMAAWVHRDGRSVILTAGLQPDGRWWLHVSVARPDRMPTYADLQDLKAFWIGGDLQALQVFPPRAKHVNIHRFCLHLWACLDPAGDGLPDFGRAGTI